MIKVLLLRLLTAFCKRPKRKETKIAIITIINVYNDKDKSDDDEPTTSL